MKKLTYLLCLCMQFAGLAQAGVSTAMSDYVLSGQTFKDWSYDFMDNGDLQLAGRIYLPTGYNPADTSKKYPLVVFYHGNGLGGGDNIVQVSSYNEINALRAAAETRDFILYLPQTIPVRDGWYRPGELPLDMSMLQVANLQSAYNIDREKLYLTGFSMGGNATWSLGGMHAGAVAALFPVDPNAGGMADSNAAQLLTKGVWGFCNRDDTTGVLYDLRYRMLGLRALDGKSAWGFPGSGGDTIYAEDLLHYTEPAVGSPSGHHANWAYLKPELYSWLLAQKNTTGWLRTGEKICFDFGNQQVASATGTDTGLSTPVSNIQTYTRPDSAGVAWNSGTANYGNNFGAAIAFAKTTAGRSTFVSLYVLGKFNDYNRTAATQTLFDANIGLDGWVTPASATGTIQLQGLTPGTNYKIELFATTEQTGTTYATTLYKTGTQTQVLTVYNNQATKATFASVASDTNGRITITVSGTNGSAYGMISTLELTADKTIPVAAPRMIGAVSRKTHGSVVKDLPIYDNWQSTPVIESRQSAVSGSHQLVFSFDQPLTGGTAAVWEGTATVSGVSFAGNQMTVNLTNVSDAQYVTISLDNVKGIASACNRMFTFGLLCGDVNRNLGVDSTDQTLVTSASGQTVTAYNFNYIYDVNCDGVINATDITLVGTKSGHQVESYIYSQNVSAEGTFVATVNPPVGGQGNKYIATIRDGVFPFVGNTDPMLQYDTFNRVAGPTEQYYGYSFSENKAFTMLVFQEGNHFSDGGWFANGTLRVQVRQNGTWVNVLAAVSPAYPNGNTKAAFGSNCETYRFILDNVIGDGIRIIGDVGGTALFTSIGELEAWATPVIPSVNLARTADATAFGTINPPVGGQGNKFIVTIRDGVLPPVGSTDSSLQYDTFTSVTPRIPEQSYGYTFTQNKTFTSLVFQEGKHFSDGGWWRDGSLKVQVRQGGNWVDVASAPSPAYPNGNTQAAFGSNYETYTFPLNKVVGDGIRITGTVGGTAQFTSIGELEAWGY